MRSLPDIPEGQKTWYKSIGTHCSHSQWKNVKQFAHDDQYTEAEAARLLGITLREVAFGPG
jgi:hypothetical protein